METQGDYFKDSDFENESNLSENKKEKQSKKVTYKDVIR